MTATAKEIAKELDRRRRRRRLVMLALIVALIAVAVTYLTCGRGFGLGGAGKGSGSGPGPGSAALRDAGPSRCTVRVTHTGLLLGGVPATRDAVVTACKTTAGADIVVTGDARQGDWDDLRVALEAAGVPMFTKQR